MGLGGERWSDSGYKHINPIRLSDGLDVKSEKKKRVIKDKAKCISSLLLCNILHQSYRTMG